MPCVVCGLPTACNFIYCPRHRKFGRLAADDQSLLAIRDAMIEGWHKDLNGFVCHYYGVLLDELSPKCPWYVSFDHITPGKKDLVVAASWVNRMKSCLTEQEFRAVIKSLAGHIRSGTPFDIRIVDSGRFVQSAERLAPRML